MQGSNSMNFSNFPDVSKVSKILRLKLLGNSDATRMYQFNTNNHASFHFW